MDYTSYISLIKKKIQFLKNHWIIFTKYIYIVNYYFRKINKHFNYYLKLCLETEMLE